MWLCFRVAHERESVEDLEDRIDIAFMFYMTANLGPYNSLSFTHSRNVPGWDPRVLSVLCVTCWQIRETEEARRFVVDSNCFMVLTAFPQVSVHAGDALMQPSFPPDDLADDLQCLRLSARCKDKDWLALPSHLHYFDGGILSTLS